MFKIKKTKYCTELNVFGFSFYINKRKILFVNPQNFCEQANPIAILDCAPYLRQRGFRVDVCNFPNLPEKKKYDFIALSCIGNCAGTIFDQIKKIKDVYPETSIIVGGKWAVTMSEEENNKLLQLNVIVEKGPAELIFTTDAEINYSKYPAWDKNDFDILYVREHLMTSRGCPYRCHYCNNTEKKISYFSPQRTVKNIELIFSKRNDVFFCDDVFVTNFEHAKAIYDLCKKENIEIENRSRFFVHVNLVNDKTIELIKLFKPLHVEIGLESGSQFILDKMNKKIKIEKIREVVPILAQHTHIKALWLIAYPYETLETLEATYMLMKELKPYVNFNWVSHYMPLPHTVGYTMAQKTGGKFLPCWNNTKPSFVPYGLSEEILVDYRNKMMQLNEAEKMVA